MALTPCEPCGCIQGNIGVQKFHQDVEIILCAILTAVGGGSVAPGHSFLVSSATQGQGVSATQDFASYVDQNLTLIVTPNAGTTNWDVTIEVSQDGTNWAPVAELTETDGITGSTISIGGTAVLHARYHVLSVTGGTLTVSLRGVSL